ncbi:uncharacterized protein Z518_10629 [Rhinocladiella mackenziei CBS 650.93]|uniref:Uncharacterized protein n=1 Tax=Rhinocladiella mackenziei CBS 650.93 TaxID=1442369 RepID=A0A0D2I408_9EURO|nr:uncharacterized protein Z518_10629 [Rhinocladiella mackenziei CBS 650.93]KIX00489.1 hypothetical protein Z518_10629 [Rhinocladiella mackenziei CBS 650.93]
MPQANSSIRYYAEYEHTLRKAHERSKSSPPSSASSSRTSSAVSLQPTSSVAEWCHQMHMIQSRKYEWCQGCHPKPPTLNVPSEKILRQQRINHEPGHAYE